jgi:hypothetical protein
MEINIEGNMINTIKILENLSKKNIKKIKHSISSNNRSDLKKFARKGTLTFEEFFNKIKIQNNKCYICLQEFRYDGGNYCNFFPSPDRIYNYDIHTENNIAASCTYCNIRMRKEQILGKDIVKSCGLCPDLEHSHTNYIPSKSELFRYLGNNNNRIHNYIKDISRYN